MAFLFFRQVTVASAESTFFVHSDHLGSTSLITDDQGAVVQRQGAGILLRKHSRPAHIRAAVEKVLEDPSYRESAGRLGDRIRERDGAQVAADSILQFAGVPG